MHPWFAKRAGYVPFSQGMLEPTNFGQYDPMSAMGLLGQHASPRYAKRVVQESPNVSFADKYQFINAINQASAQSPAGPGGSVQLSKMLPALAGAGLGWLGASLVAPILGLDPKTKHRLGIGAAALGAVVNSLPQWLKAAQLKQAGPLNWLGDKSVDSTLDRFKQTGTFATPQNGVKSWLKRRYLANPRNQEHVRQALLKRLQDPSFLSQAFQNS